MNYPFWIMVYIVIATLAGVTIAAICEYVYTVAQLKFLDQQAAKRRKDSNQ